MQEEPINSNDIINKNILLIHDHLLKILGENSNYQALEPSSNDGNKKYFYLLLVDDFMMEYNSYLSKQKQIPFCNNQLIKKEIREKYANELLYIKQYLNYLKMLDLIELSNNINTEKVVYGVPSIEDLVPNCYLNQEYKHVVVTSDDEENVLSYKENNLSFFISPSFRDSERINFLNKKFNNQKIHFKKCIMRFQGKINSKKKDYIPVEIMENLKKRIAFYNLSTQLKNGQQDYTKVTKGHIFQFLKEDGHNKYYDDINYIHHQITKIPTHNISYLEEKLLQDFETVMMTYNNYCKNKNIEKKGFKNKQILLYQLLKRNNYNCDINDFHIIKAIDRKQFYDEICKEVFLILGWNFFPLL